MLAVQNIEASGVIDKPLELVCLLHCCEAFSDIDEGDAGIQRVIGLLDRYVKRLVCH